MDMMGEYTGAAVIFGATGGVMEAALRTVADILEEDDLPEFEYTTVRGVDQGVKGRGCGWRPEDQSCCGPQYGVQPENFWMRSEPVRPRIPFY